MKQYPLWTLALTVGLSLAGAAHAGATETVVAQAAGDQQPGVIAFYDSADGKTSGIDNSMSQNLASALAGAQYLLTDAGHLVVLPAQASDSSAQPVLPVANAIDVSNGQGRYYLVHMRSASSFLDGAVSRDPQDPSASYVILDLLLFDQQGDSEAIHIEQNLTWATGPAAGTDPSGGSNLGNNNSPGNGNPQGGGTPADGGNSLGGGSNPLGGSNPTDGSTSPGGSSPLGGSDPTGGSSPPVL